MAEVIWLTLKIIWYSMLVYGFVLFVSTITEKDRTITDIIIATVFAIFYFWANLG
jgi:hypothetical protein